ncbi:hypothetical protein OS493_032970 [Desmophyllum pertusum]|uniref:Mitogen-activated protein kinase kinase kinase 19 n=1 Tax=Desmophyllum pertusum TaxID=174260 RepID=A0A9W9Y8G1_9CNID|nr:hypothetical protein OS493_032970 [Desmophyllum pertusum]
MTKGGLSDGHCTRTKNYMRHYHDCTSRLFSNGRADDYLNELFLNAAKNGDFERVQNFLARTSRNTSVNVDAKDKEGGYTAVMLAAMNEHEKVVSLLLNYGADITLCNSRGQSVLDFASDSMRPLLLGSVTRQGYSSRHLLQAAWQGNSQLVKKLLSSKSLLDVNCKNADGLTPLLLVTRDLNLFEKIEKAVMENGYHPVEVVKELIHHNADCGAKDSEGKRPLHFAAHGKGNFARHVVDVLIEKGASEIDMPDRFSNSPLHWATIEDNQPILLALIKGASHGFGRTSDTLLHHGADVTITDDNGLSPVDVAKGRRVQVVLKDAWAEQTKDNKLHSKRILSAPVPPHIQQDSVQPSPEVTEQKQQAEQVTVLSESIHTSLKDSTIRISTAPSQGVERKLKKRSQNSVEETSLLDERTSIPSSRKMSDVRMPRIASAQKTELSPGPRSTYNSGSVSRVQSGKQELGIKDMQTSVALPSLSVLNIELTCFRNLRGEKQVSRNRRTSSQLPSPPNYRLRHRLSSPVLTYQRRISPPGTPGNEIHNNTRTAQENITFVPEIVDLDLLSKEGLLSGGVASSVFLSSEIGEVAPPPPSPRVESRYSNRSQENRELTPTQASDDETDMTRTFTSIPRSTFWIPVGENDTEKNEPPSVEKDEESSSNGTQFYIDLSNLEALALGQCSLCGTSLPERTPASRRDSISSSPDKEMCKSCKPCRGSNEDVFWIPFTEKRKASALKNLNGVENGDDSAKPNARRKSNEQNNTEDRVQRKSMIQLLKDLSSSSNAVEESTTDYGKIVKTVGEVSSLAESTVIARPTNGSAPPTRAIVASKNKSLAKKENDIILKSFSETDIHNPVAVAPSSKTTLRNTEEKEHVSGEVRQRGPSQDTKLPHTQEALNETGHDSAILNTTVEPSPPKQAWTTPRSEEPGASSVTIINAYPSPVPPVDKSAIHPPIGPATANKKLTSGKKGKKGGKPASNSTKTAKPRTKSKVSEQNGKGGKKKGKAKKKGDMKMITVQQREAGEELGLRMISQGGLDVAEESMDYLSTFRPFNARMLKGKHAILSPIPESPRSTRNSPRSTVSTPRVVDFAASLREDNTQVQERNAKGLSDVGAMGEGVPENSEGVAREGEFDVVDGGMFSRVIGMCVPRLKFGKSDLSGSDEECSEPLLKHPHGGGVGKQQREPVETRSTEDRLRVEQGGEYQQVIQDEADDVMEDLIRRGLSLEEEREGNGTQFDQHSDSRSRFTTDDSLTNVTSHSSSSLSQVKTSEESSVLTYRYSTEVPAESDLANEEPTSDMSSYSEQYSDTDSSYNSCGSTSPRPLSPASSLNSSDTYFSSPRDSSCTDTPTPDRDMYSENSVEIEYYERMTREKSGISSSSSSSSTIRTQSNASRGSVGNISQGSVGSLAENVVRSRLSASSRSSEQRSQSSASCEEEIFWKKGNVLGRGAFGTVWCGLTNTGEMIAVKQVELNHSNIDEAEEQYEKLQEEVFLLKSLKHKNIVKFIGTCLDGGVVNIFMEYVPGGSIASILARFGCLDEPVFRRYTKQLLSGVSYLHGNNVIHRDIKGGNILVMPSGVLKLIDFGCAKRLYMNLSMSRSNILRSMKGTPYWMAPEVIRETGHGRKSDIWSVGCTVFEMATGKPPWSDMPPMAAIFAIGSGSLAVPHLGEDFSPGARDFVDKCLTRDPDLRPSADELLQHYFLKDPL